MGDADANVAACFLAYASGYYAHTSMEIFQKQNHLNDSETMIVDQHHSFYSKETSVDFESAFAIELQS